MTDNARGFAAGGDASPVSKVVFSPSSTSAEHALPASEYPYLLQAVGLTGQQTVEVSQVLTHLYTREVASETISQQLGPYKPNSLPIALTSQRTVLALPAGIEYRLNMTPAALGTAVVTAVLYRGAVPLPDAYFVAPLNALNGYTTTAAAATTTELPTDGGYGIHKNSTSGDVHLCFNDGGTIKSVQLV